MPYALPAYQVRSFQVTTNTAPVANDDSAVVVINGVTGVGEPITIRVTANDYDPEGSDVRLTSRAIVEAPSEGLVVRLNDDEILFQPNAWAWRDDSFIYEIEDESGRLATGVVELSFLWGIILP